MERAELQFPIQLSRLNERDTTLAKHRTESNQAWQPELAEGLRVGAAPDVYRNSIGTYQNWRNIC